MTGEEWLVKKTGAYLPGAYEEVVTIVNAFVLNDKVVRWCWCFGGCNGLAVWWLLWWLLVVVDGFADGYGGLVPRLYGLKSGCGGVLMVAVVVC